MSQFYSHYVFLLTMTMMKRSLTNEVCILCIYLAIFTRKFRRIEVGSKSRTTEYKGKGRVIRFLRMSEGILLLAVTRPEIFPAMEKYKREFHKERKREEGRRANRAITWRKSRSINDMVPARQRWRLSRSKGAVGHRVLTPTNQFTSLEKSFAKTRGKMTAGGRNRENRITADNISHRRQFVPQTFCFCSKMIN